MTFTTLALTALLGQAPVNSTQKFDVTMNSNAAGSAEMVVKDLPEGKRQVTLTLDLRIGNAKSRVRQETFYDAKGAATRKIQEGVVNGKDRKLVVAEMDAKGANVTIQDKGKTTTKSVPVSATAPRENPSLFWFQRSTPKLGEAVSYYSFDMSELAWRLETVTYTKTRTENMIGGPQKLPVLSVSRMNGDAEVVLWPKGGLPFRITMNNGALVLQAETHSVTTQKPK